MAWRMGARDMQKEQDRAVSRKVERGRAWVGQVPLLLTWDKPHQPHPHPHPHPRHLSSAEPLEARMARTLGRLGCYPSLSQMP